MRAGESRSNGTDTKGRGKDMNSKQMKASVAAVSVWYVAPEDGGQIVEVSYGLDGESGVAWRRTHDRSDGATRYAYTDDAGVIAAWGPWNGAPNATWTQVQGEGVTMATLRSYETGDEIRSATAEELRESIEASRVDGGAGVITVDVDGRLVRAYVEGRLSWRDCQVYDAEGHELTGERHREALLEFRATNGMGGAWFVDVSGMSAAAMQRACEAGPSVADIDWAGIDALPE